MSLYVQKIENEFAEELYDEILETSKDDIINESIKDENKSRLYKVEKFRKILEKLFLDLTKDLTGYESVNNAVRMHAIFEKYTVDKEIKDKCTSLRAQLNEYHHPYHKDSITEEEYLIYLKTLCEIIKYFSGTEIPYELQKTYEPVKKLQLKAKEEPPKENIEFIKAYVLKYECPKNQPMHITCISENKQDYLHIYVYNNNPLYQKLIRILREKVPLNIFNIQKAADKPFYTPKNNTVFIIEPDYLVNVTHIKECFTNRYDIIPEIYLFNKFRQDNKNENMIKGNIANYMLDTLLYEYSNYKEKDRTNKEEHFNSIFNKAVKEFALDIISIADRFNLKEKIEKLKDSSKTYYIAINNFIGTEIPIKKERKKENSYPMLHIEPNFLSTKIGMQGRFDLLCEIEENENDKQYIKKNIYELKSASKVPEKEPWPNDKIQVFCYDLILRTIVLEKRGESKVLYCNKEFNNLLPVIASDKLNLMYSIIHVRNQIVDYEYRLANGELTLDSIAEEIKKQKNNFPPYIMNNIDNFCQTISKLPELQKAYINKFIQFTAQEQWISKVGKGDEKDNSRFYGYSSLWKLSERQKNEDNIIFSDLEFDNEKSNLDELLISFKRNLFSHTSMITVFREGDPCILYPKDKNKDNEEDPTKRIFLKGTIDSIKNEYITVKLRNPYPNKMYFKNPKWFWFIEQDITDNFADMLYKSLYEFADAERDKQEILLGLKKPEFEQEIQNSNYYKDEYINGIIARAVAAKNYFLIQGPPGTAKTSVMLTGLVKYLYEKTQENIFLLAYTNRAVDEICKNLEKNKIRFLRLGRSVSNPEYCLDTLKKEKDIYEINDIVNECRIFVSTVHTAYSSPIFNMKTFNTAIIDEATQLLEPQIVGMLTRFNRFIMIGDEKQLPPVVIQEHTNVEDKELKKIKLYSLSNSIFERLLINAKENEWDCHAMLRTQYRMNEEIADFVNKHYYDNELISGTERQKQTIQRFSSNSKSEKEKVLSKHRIIFIDSRKEKGKTNKYEAEIIKEFVKIIVQSYGKDFTEETLGIITPFRAQINVIRKTLIDNNIPEEYTEKITIDTVERFQGSERDIIIVSFAINNARKLDLIKSLTFNKKVDRKLNVTLTRAREHLILVGCHDVLKKDEHYERLITYIKQKGGFYEEK